MSALADPIGRDREANRHSGSDIVSHPFAVDSHARSTTSFTTNFSFGHGIEFAPRNASTCWEGYVHPDFWRVAKTLERIIPRTGAGGAALCIYHRGEKVVDLWGGTRDEYGNRWESDTLALSYSTTKGIASTLLHILADRGLVDYDKPVAHYWPEFAAGGKERITVRQVMCHEARLYSIRALVDDAQHMLDWNYMVGALANTVPMHPPGTAHGYHALTYGWLVGELAQRVTGKPFGELLQSEIATPLELDGLYVGLPEDQMHRRARLLVPKGHDDPSRFQRTVRNAKRLNRGFAALRVPIDLAQGCGGSAARQHARSRSQ